MKSSDEGVIGNGRRDILVQKESERSMTLCRFCTFHFKVSVETLLGMYRVPRTVIRFVSFSAKFGIFTALDLDGTLK